jgi:acetyltransferase-like isoleucine patch superfamily enzyme
MPIDIKNGGDNSDCSVAPAVIERGTGAIILEGAGNRIEIAEQAEIGHLHVQLSGGSSLVIGAGCILRNLFIYACNHGSVRIGGGTGFNGFVRLLLHEPGVIAIGQNCLFGGDTDLTVSDMHSILDARTGRRTNPAKDISIADHVWIGQKATILKGVSIGRDSIVAAGAIVTRPIPAGCIAAGNPARVVKEGVTWSHDLL